MRIKYIYPQLFESNLTGKSRSGGVSNWEHYVVRNFSKNNQYVIESNGDIFDQAENKIGTVKGGDLITITSPKIISFSNRIYASVKLIPSGLNGLVRINIIQKPTTKSKNSVIPGGKNSKEFTPEKLGLVGIRFSSKSQLANTIKGSLISNYGDSKYENIRRYIYESIRSTVGIGLNESFSKKFNINNVGSIDNGDISILSKNFGEVLGALYILSTNKKVSHVEFPKDISQGLYDFISVENNGKTNYYSVKSLGGSSTSLENINFVLRNFSDNNTFLNKHGAEVDIIRSLMNNKQGGLTTIRNIENFFNTTLSDKVSKILVEMNRISSYRLKNMSQPELDKWFDSMLNTVDVSKFITTMNTIYSSILGDIGNAPKSTSKVLEEIYLSGSGSPFNHGYILYPMGSYIVTYLNNVGNYREVLNTILNFGSYIHQLTVNMYISNLEINISSFKKQNFKFSYNAGTKYPGNRPIGFIKT
jgi:hypothetical protein